jgi:hypothetical protein
MNAVQVERIEQLCDLIGRELGPTDWLEITQADIDKFAEVSRDDQWIHVDTERAATESPYGTTVAHGNLDAVVARPRPSPAHPQQRREGGDQLWVRPRPVPGGGPGRIADTSARAEVVSVDELG